MVGSLIDISKRKNAEIALMEERARIDLVLESVPVNVYFKDHESRFVRANKATAIRVGAGSVKELIGKTDHDFFEKVHADASRANELKIMETGAEQVEELEHETWEDREDTWVLVTKKVWRNMNGEVLGTVGVTNDVTELMKTRENLERVAEQLQIVNQDIDEERSLLRLVIDNIPMFVYFKDLESNFVLVNQGMADLCNEDSPDDLVEKHDRDYFEVLPHAVPHDITHNESHAVVFERQHFEEISRQFRCRTVEMLEPQGHRSFIQFGGHGRKLFGNQRLLHFAGQPQLLFHFLVL